MPHPPTGANAPATGDGSAVRHRDRAADAGAGGQRAAAGRGGHRARLGRPAVRARHCCTCGTAATRGPVTCCCTARPSWPGTRTWTRATRPRAGQRRARHPPGVPAAGARAAPDPRAAGRGGPAAAAAVGPRRPARGRARLARGRVRAGPGAVADAAVAADPAAGAAASPTASPSARSCRPGRGRPGSTSTGAFASHPEQGAWTARGPGPARAGILVRPGRVLPGRAGREAGRVSLDEGPQPGESENRPGSGMKPGARDASARCTSSASIPPSAAPAWAAR